MLTNMLIGGKSVQQHKEESEAKGFNLGIHEGYSRAIAAFVSSNQVELNRKAQIEVNKASQIQQLQIEKAQLQKALDEQLKMFQEKYEQTPEAEPTPDSTAVVDIEPAKTKGGKK